MTEEKERFLLVSNAVEMEGVGRFGDGTVHSCSAFSGLRLRRGSMGRNQHRHRTFVAVSKCLITMLMVRICCSLSYLITKPMTEATYHPAVTPNSLPDSIFLEIFAFCLSSISSDYLYNTRHAQAWQILV